MCEREKENVNGLLTKSRLIRIRPPEKYQFALIAWRFFQLCVSVCVQSYIGIWMFLALSRSIATAAATFTAVATDAPFTATAKFMYFLYLLVARMLDFSVILSFSLLSFLYECVCRLDVCFQHFLFTCCPTVVRDILRSVFLWWIWFMSCQMSS